MPLGHPHRAGFAIKSILKAQCPGAPADMRLVRLQNRHRMSPLLKLISCHQARQTRANDDHFQFAFARGSCPYLPKEPLSHRRARCQPRHPKYIAPTPTDHVPPGLNISSIKSCLLRNAILSGAVKSPTQQDPGVAAEHLLMNKCDEHLAVLFLCA
jgi:hypothetical protein